MRSFYWPVIILGAGLLSCAGAPSDVVRLAPLKEPVPLQGPNLDFAVDVGQLSTELLRQAPVFDRALVPVGQPSHEDNLALARVMEKYTKQSDRDDCSVFTAYLEEYPGSAWAASVRLNMAGIWYLEGRYSRAMDAYRQIWEAFRNEKSGHAAELATEAMAGYARMLSQVGRREELSELLDSPHAKRNREGRAGEIINRAERARWALYNREGVAYRCGSLALLNMAKADNQTLGEKRFDSIRKAQSTPAGFSLQELAVFAEQAGLNYVPVRVKGKQDIPVPSVVHWKAGHYAAIIAQSGGAYIVRDPTFGDGGNRRISRDALLEEASGNFLAEMDEQKNRDKLERISPSAADKVFGRGLPDTENGRATGDEEDTCGGCPPKEEPGMAGYKFLSMLGALVVRDTPLVYQPALGAPLEFRITYCEKELNNYNGLGGFFGPKWRFNWSSWVIETSVSAASMELALPGGGSRIYEFPVGESVSLENGDDKSVLERLGSGAYRLIYVDGSSMEYSWVTSAAPPRRLLLTKKVDPQGLQVFLGYDSTSRLISITDPSGGVANLAYHTGDRSKLVASITDPAGRAAYFTYNLVLTYNYMDGMGDYAVKLVSVLDPVGIESQIKYRTGAVIDTEPVNSDSIESITTPYGRTNFYYWSTPSYWGVTASGTATGTESILYRDTFDVPSFLTEAELPSIDLVNSYLEYRNSRYTNRQGGTTLYHWLHDENENGTSMTGSVLESVVKSGESRVWFNYDGQIADAFLERSAPYSNIAVTYAGTSESPVVTARLVPAEDGSGTMVSQIERRAYNSLGKLTRHRDPAGRETIYEYHPSLIDLKRVARITQRGSTALPHPLPDDFELGDLPTGWTYEVLASYTYDSTFPRLVQNYTDAAGQLTSYTYNPAGQIRTVTNAKNETTTYWYHPTGQPSGALSPTATGFVVKIDGPLTGSTDSQDFLWDTAGRVSAHTDESLHTRTFTYDNLNRPRRTTYPDGTYEQITYDRLDPHVFRDRLGRTSTVTHNALRLPVEFTDHENRLTQMTWCTCGSVASITDPLNRTTNFTYDGHGRPLTRTFPAVSGQPANVFTYGPYDVAGRLTQSTDARGLATQYRYTIDGRLAARIPVGGSDTYPTPATFFDYDDHYPRLASVNDQLPVGTALFTTSLSYHPVGQLGALRVAGMAGPLASSTLSYTYDQLGRVLSRQLTGDTVAEQWTYDALGRINQITNPLGTFTHAYEGNSARLNTQTRSGGLVLDYDYQPVLQDYRLAAITARKPGGTVLAAQGYVSNVVGRIDDWTQTRADQSVSTWDIGYSDDDELLSVQQTQPATGQQASYAYTYDDAGNRETEQKGAYRARLVNNARNQLTTEKTELEVKGQISADADSARFTHTTFPASGSPQRTSAPLVIDANRQMIGTATLRTGRNLFEFAITDLDGEKLFKRYEVNVPFITPKDYAYDKNGNLVLVSSLGVVLKTYAWDRLNRLVAWGDGTGVKGRFIYDGLGRRTLEKDAAGTAVVRQWVWEGARPIQERDATGTITRRWYAEGELRRVASALVSRYYARDHLGSVVAVVDAQNHTVAGYAYDPYGQRVQIAGTENYEAAYTGHYWHAGLGLYLTLFRAYDAENGRWLSRDPMQERGGLNLYGYVGNNPINFIDVFGLCPDECDQDAQGKRDQTISRAKSKLTRDGRWAALNGIAAGSGTALATRGNVRASMAMAALTAALSFGADLGEYEQSIKDAWDDYKKDKEKCKEEAQNQSQNKSGDDDAKVHFSAPLRFPSPGSL